MGRKIKIIWDFRGPDALKIAEHHKLHLQEYADQNQLVMLDIGIENISDLYALAYITVNEKDVLMVRDALKPHRAELAG